MSFLVLTDFSHVTVVTRTRFYVLKSRENTAIYTVVMKTKMKIRSTTYTCAPKISTVWISVIKTHITKVNMEFTTVYLIQVSLPCKNQRC